MTADELKKKYAADAEKRAAEDAKALTAKQDALIADLNRQTQEAQGQIQSQISTVGNDYERQFNINAANEWATRRQIAESMANFNLTSAGLNATNQMAMGVTRGNADRDTSLKKQAAIDSLNQSLANMISQAQTQQSNIRIQTADEIAKNRQSLLSQAEQNAVSQYNAQLEASQKAAAAQQESAAALKKQQTDLYTKLAMGGITEEQYNLLAPLYGMAQIVKQEQQPVQSNAANAYKPLARGTQGATLTPQVGSVGQQIQQTQQQQKLNQTAQTNAAVSDYNRYGLSMASRISSGEYTRQQAVQAIINQYMNYANADQAIEAAAKKAGVYSLLQSEMFLR